MAHMQPHAHDPSPAYASPRSIGGLLVFCGSRTGHDPAHAQTARDVGRLLAGRGTTLVYGGGARGLMGEMARAALEAGGRVEGIIPRFLVELEVAQAGLAELVIVESLHVRKAEMFQRADAVLALPGGIGTLDELVEILSWRNLGLHDRPIFLLGDGDFWQPFLVLLEHLAASGFANPKVVAELQRLPDVAALDALLGAA